MFERVTQYPVLGIRDAAYLRWRYADNPLYDTHAILVRDQGHLIGYALFTLADDMLNVKDVFWSGDDGLVETLVWSLLVQARKRNACSVSFAGLEGHPIFDTLTKFGFSMRSGSSQMFAYAPDASDAARFVFDRKNWLLAVGDRDV